MSATTMLRDDDGRPTRDGDTVQFSYGIPPRVVRAKIVQRGKSLIALTPTEAVTECNLRRLRYHVSVWYRINRSISDQT